MLIDATREGLLLGNAVDIASSVDNLSGVHPHCPALREQRLNLPQSQGIVFISVLGHDHAAVGDQEIRVRSNADISCLPIRRHAGVCYPVILRQPDGPLRTAQFMYFQPASSGIHRSAEFSYAA